MARAEIAASAEALATASALPDVATMLWHCIMSGLVGTAHSLAPAGCFGRLGDCAAATAGNCPVVGGVAAVAEPALASPGNVKAATARHAPTVAYNLGRKVNSPKYVMRDPVELNDTMSKNS